MSQIPEDLEVGYVPLSMGGAYPGLYLFTIPSRFVRPVKNISIPSVEGQNVELIGPFEQVNMVFLLVIVLPRLHLLPSQITFTAVIRIIVLQEDK